MYCPKCRAEYRDGVTVCPECRAPLAEVPATAPPSPDDPLVPVLRTADVALLPVVKSVLDAARVPYVVQGDQTMGLFPLGRFAVGVSRRALGAIVLVPESREDEARELIEGSAEAPPGHETD